MTRFARAKGSKSCNAKQPEEPTSWAEMKKGIQMQQVKQEDYTSAKSALDSVKNHKKDQHKPSVWGTLGGTSDADASDALSFMRAQLKKRKENINNNDADGLSSNQNKGISSMEGKKKKKKGESGLNGNEIKSNKEEDSNKKLNGISEAEIQVQQKLPVKKKKYKSKNKNKNVSSEDMNFVNDVNRNFSIKMKQNNEETNEISENKNEVQEKKSKQLKKDKNKEAEEVKSDEPAVKNKRKKIDENPSETLETVIPKKKTKKLNKIENGNTEKVGEGKNDGLSDNIAKKGKKRKLNDAEDSTKNGIVEKKKKTNFAEKKVNSDNVKSPKKKTNLKRQNRKKMFEELKQKRLEKREKLKDLSPQERRRKPLPETQEAHINGQSVQLEMFDGFWVTKEDAERLKKLKNEMFEKKIPFKDVNNAIKLERRRAEKALARLKKKVCFQCRKSGHALSECPEISENPNKATNVCYKCGSTEHTAYLCKVSQGNQFRFAECFICKEQGHIAKQCPDNPRGLYPKGGACNVCGDVTHLKKDCPRLQSSREEEAISAGLRDDRMIEDLDEQLIENKNNGVISNVKRNKHVKF